MGYKFIVLGFKKAGEKATVLADPSVPPPTAQQICHQHSSDTAFEEVQMFALLPHTRVFHPRLQAAVDARAGKTITAPETAPAAEPKKKNIFQKTGDLLAGK